jgi:hypothetical protein
MSLRDALLSAGVVKKKDVRQVNRELKKKRKKGQSKKDKKKVLQKQQAELVAAEKQAKLEERRAARNESRAEAQARGRALRTRHIVQAHEMRFRPGPVRFHHLTADGRLALKLNLPWSIAHGLKNGQYAVAVLSAPFQEDRYVVIDRASAERVPEALVFFNQTAPEDVPENGLLEECLSPS